MAIMTACGQPNPTATSSDDTHSAAKGSQDTSDQSGSAMGLAESSRANSDVTTTVLNSGSTTTVVSSLSTKSSLTSSPSPSSSGSGGGTANNPSSPTTTIVNGKVRPAPTIAPECDVMPLADRQNVDLRGLELFYANFQGANLSGANMSGMDLTGADFAGANLTGANLIGATLDYAFFLETNLTGAKLTRASMSGIIWDDSTIWPVGFVPPDY